MSLFDLSKGHAAWPERLAIFKGRSLFKPLVVLGCLWLAGQATLVAQPSQRMEAFLGWDKLPAFPARRGLSGAFTGVVADLLIVAGGVSVSPDQAGTGSFKRWSDRILLLPGPHDNWREVGTLPRPLAHGVSVSSKDGLIMLGGAGQGRHYAEVALLRWVDGNIEIVRLPPMPMQVAYFCGARLGDTIFVAGGREQPDSPSALKTFWALDLTEQGIKIGWRELEPWPGPARLLATAGVQDGSFFLFGGADLTSEQGLPGKLRPLRDAYRYTPGRGWKRVADLPRRAVGSPNPAVALGQSHLMVLGGGAPDVIDFLPGSTTDQAGRDSDILVYHTITDTWVSAGELRLEAEVAGKSRRSQRLPTLTGTTWWRGGLVVPGGEVQPGVSTSRVLRARPLHKTLSFSAIGYGVLSLYLATLVVIGFYFSTRAKSTADFFLGGRRVPWWAAGVSLLGTQLSSITFLTVPAKAYATDWTYLVAYPAALVATPLIVSYYLPFFRRLNVTTAYEYLEKRFNLLTRLIGSASFICLQLGRMGIVLYLPALSVSLVTGINVYACIAVMGLLTALYCLLGGIEAVIWTDVLQVIVMLGSALIILFMIAFRVEGGFETILSQGVDHDKFRLANWNWDLGTASLWVIVIGNFFNTFPPLTADQTNVQRYLTTRDEKGAARSIWTNTLLTLLASFIFFGLGTALWAFYKTQPSLLNPSGQTDAILLWFVVQQLPEGIAALAIAGLLASAMSSLDSSLNSIATVITTDVYRRFNPAASDRQCLKLARLLILLFAVLGTGSALYLVSLGSSSMWDHYIKIVGLFGGGLAGLFAAGIFTRRISGSGVVLGFFLSALTLYYVQAAGTISFFLFSGIGIVTCLGGGWLASFWLPESEKSIRGLTIYTLENRDVDSLSEEG